MNTLKTLVVIAVLAIVGYGLYIGLNNGFQFQASDMPDWLELGSAPDEPETNVGAEQPDLANGQNQVAGVLGPTDPATARYPDADQKIESPPIAAVKETPTGPLSSDTIPNSLNGRSTANLREPILKKTENQADEPSVTPNDTTLAKSEVVPPANLPNPTDNVSGTQSTYPQAPQSSATFQATMDSVQRLLRLEQYSDALLTLSTLYEDPGLSPEQNNKLVELLDQVAGTVIYSRKHTVSPAYLVEPGERLEDIAKKHNVPTGLLAKINGISAQSALTPGQELKVVQGPFNAVINVDKSEMTLWVGGRYAGRFSLTLGPEILNQQDSQTVSVPFVVKNKTRPHPQFGDQPWIQLGSGYGSGADLTQSGQQIGIAGMAEPAQAVQYPGRIGVSVRDADDLYDILSYDSKVTIKR